MQAGCAHPPYGGPAVDAATAAAARESHSPFECKVAKQEHRR